MVREKVKVSTRTLQWKCVESRTYGKRLHYGRFILSPLMKDLAPPKPRLELRPRSKVHLGILKFLTNHSNFNFFSSLDAKLY